MAEDTPKVPLVKEVLAPQSPYSGMGVVLVASMAMFLAMASSAFVIRARMVRQSCTAYQGQLPPAQSWHESERPAEPACGTGHQRYNPDGSVTVFFEACKQPVGVQLLDVEIIDPETVPDPERR